jgi:hypothetical protein
MIAMGEEDDGIGQALAQMCGILMASLKIEGRNMNLIHRGRGDGRSLQHPSVYDICPFASQNEGQFYKTKTHRDRDFSYLDELGFTRQMSALSFNMTGGGLGKQIQIITCTIMMKC